MCHHPAPCASSQGAPLPPLHMPLTFPRGALWELAGCIDQRHSPSRQAVLSPLHHTPIPADVFLPPLPGWLHSFPPEGARSADSRPIARGQMTSDVTAAALPLWGI
mmetsp:Transcript_29059/g.56931  ORF Transcript_29059/g.56931 Transcript_29059/m.56931 type:complete len:106 (+) Transcript_29059:105-422(+)